MKSLRFESICLLSYREKKARKEIFHKGLNLVIGRNHTGKSSLIKSLYVVLGAVPQGKLDKWDTDCVSLLKLSIDGISYEVVQQGKQRGLFKNGHLEAATSNSTEWGAQFCKITGFNLVLTDKDQQAVKADARAFFLPFYINQDGSWNSGWGTFENLTQYKAPVRPILDYFSGVKPPVFYALNAEKDQKKTELGELHKEEKMIGQVRERLGKSISLTGPKTMPEVFAEDVKLLTEEVNKLNTEQEKLRSDLVKDGELLHSINLQLLMAQRAIDTFGDDSEFLNTDSDAVLVCPICQAEHHRSFLDVLKYAEDARVLRQLASRLEADASTMRHDIAQKEAASSSLMSRYRQISEILETKRGELKFADVVKSMGAESAFVAFDAELKDLKTRIDAILSDIDAIDSKLKPLLDTKRAKSIVARFRKAYDQARQDLNLPLADSDKMQLSSRPDVSGSGGPRSILAYYGALWAVTSGDHGSYLPPLVVDAPQQQGQDEFNLPKVIEYLAKKLPPRSQVILGIEGRTETPFDKIVSLTEPYGLLQVGQFEDVSEEVSPRIDAMSAALAQR